jgi:hypothetical protein
MIDPATPADQKALIKKDCFPIAARIHWRWLKSWMRFS